MFKLFLSHLGKNLGPLNFKNANTFNIVEVFYMNNAINMNKYVKIISKISI